MENKRENPVPRPTQHLLTECDVIIDYLLPYMAKGFPKKRVQTRSLKGQYTTIPCCRDKIIFLTKGV